MKVVRGWYLLAIVLLLLAPTTVRLKAQDQCPPGYFWSRETITCEQETCPPGSGRNYTLECVCPEGQQQAFEERTDPATGDTYSYMVACRAPNAAPSTTAFQTLSNWWDQRDTTTKGVIIVGATGALIWILVSTGAIAALAGAIGGAAAAVSTAQALITRLITGYITGKIERKFASYLLDRAVEHLKKDFAKELAKMSKTESSSFLRKQVLDLVNKALAELGKAPWNETSLDLFLRGMGYLL